jgi:hypothetical protein
MLIPPKPATDTLRRAAVTLFAHAVGVAVVALALPTLPMPVPMAVLMPKPSPVVARTAVVAIAAETAP